MVLKLQPPLATSWVVTAFALWDGGGPCVALGCVSSDPNAQSVGASARPNQPLPPEYLQAFKLWALLGIPAFGGHGDGGCDGEKANAVVGGQGVTAVFR